MSADREAAIREAGEYLLNKRRLGSFYLDSVRLLMAEIETLREQLALRVRDLQTASMRVTDAEQRAESLRLTVQTALDHWPGEAHLGSTYYTLLDALADLASDQHREESAARGRGIDEENERQRRRAALLEGEE